MTEQTVEALLPCPFCGCTDISNKDDWNYEWIECDFCHASGGYDPAFEDRSVQQHWNTRAAIAVMPAVSVEQAAKVLLAEHRRCQHIEPRDRTGAEHAAAQLGRNRLRALTGETP